jgi:hypothetical protein
MSSSDRYTYVSPPTVVAAGVPTIGSTAAGLSGSVVPSGLPTSVRWQYGLDSTYRGPGFSGNVLDQSTPSQVVGADFASHALLGSVSNLIPNAVYHVRLVALNSAGTTFGPDQTFKTGRAPAPPPPVLGRSENLAPVGKVFVLLNGGFVPLTEPTRLPSGTEVDALHGSVNLAAASGNHGKTFTGNFGGAVFRIVQTRTGANKGLTTLTLVEGAFPGAPTYASCPKAATDGTPLAHAALSRRVLQTLRSSEHGGRFSSRGRYSAATVRGTQWDTTDRCDGTLTVVHSGTVSVNDFVHHKMVTLHAGRQYLATKKK